MFLFILFYIFSNDSFRMDNLKFGAVGVLSVCFRSSVYVGFCNSGPGIPLRLSILRMHWSGELSEDSLLSGAIIICRHILLKNYSYRGLFLWFELLFYISYQCVRFLLPCSFSAMKWFPVLVVCGYRGVSRSIWYMFSLKGSLLNLFPHNLSLYHLLIISFGCTGSWESSFLCRFSW